MIAKLKRFWHAFVISKDVFDAQFRPIKGEK